MTNNSTTVLDKEDVLYLSLNECIALFPGLKEKESSLSKEERKILLRLEKVLYENLSINEMEELLYRTS